jgi:hypothetical protein
MRPRRSFSETRPDLSIHISHVCRVTTTVKDGMVYQNSALYQALGFKP